MDKKISYRLTWNKRQITSSLAARFIFFIFLTNHYRARKLMTLKTIKNDHKNGKKCPKKITKISFILIKINFF